MVASSFFLVAAAVSSALASPLFGMGQAPKRAPPAPEKIPCEVGFFNVINTHDGNSEFSEFQIYNATQDAKVEWVAPAVDKLFNYFATTNCYADIRNPLNSFIFCRSAHGGSFSWYEKMQVFCPTSDANECYVVKAINKDGKEFSFKQDVFSQEAPKTYKFVDTHKTFDKVSVEFISELINSSYNTMIPCQVEESAFTCTGLSGQDIEKFDVTCAYETSNPSTPAFCGFHSL